MIIVTGGAGFIGSAVVWRLNQLGMEDILIVDHLGTGEKWKNLVPLRFRDYLEKDEFLRFIGPDGFPKFSGNGQTAIEAIIHLGACSSTTEQDATYLVRNNFEYTKQLALFATANGIRFIYASSAATYGDGANGFSDDEGKLNELRPLNMYGYSKKLFDVWAKANGLLDKIVGLKYFNVFGPNEYHKADMRSLVIKAYEQVVSTGKICLFKSHRNDYTDGEQKRDFLYVKDAVEMTLHFLDNRNSNGVFNIGSGEANTWNRLAAAIFRSLGKPERIEYIDMPETIREKYQYYTRADITNLRRAGYDKPLKPLEEAVEDYVANYLVTQKRLGEG
jgi:ADP-L-glycero-D-manno-heptose 6-epimerase